MLPLRTIDTLYKYYRRTVIESPPRDGCGSPNGLDQLNVWYVTCHASAARCYDRSTSLSLDWACTASASYIDDTKMMMATDMHGFNVGSFGGR